MDSESEYIDCFYRVRFVVCQMSSDTLHCYINFAAPGNELAPSIAPESPDNISQSISLKESFEPTAVLQQAWILFQVFLDHTTGADGRSLAASTKERVAVHKWIFHVKCIEWIEFDFCSFGELLVNLMTGRATVFSTYREHMRTK